MLGEGLFEAIKAESLKTTRKLLEPEMKKWLWKHYEVRSTGLRLLKRDCDQWTPLYQVCRKDDRNTEHLGLGLPSSSWRTEQAQT